MSEITNEIKKRRTFAIISHPDAGKTTLTEKFLLYGGAINQAGSVKGKATAKHAVSDWMEIEKERGISVTSSVLQFSYGGYCINILDTPGHQDFSEDTYRTLLSGQPEVHSDLRTIRQSEMRSRSEYHHQQQVEAYGKHRSSAACKSDVRLRRFSFLRKKMLQPDCFRGRPEHFRLSPELPVHLLY